MRVPIQLRRFNSKQRGFTMLETMFAVAVFFVGITGLMALATVSLGRANSQGNQTTKETEFAQDKMEAILSLPYTSTTTDTSTDLTKTPPQKGAGCCGLTANSSTCDFTASNPTCYTDYLTPGGVAQSSSTGAQYMRRWRIQDDASGNFKTITVQVKALNGADYNTSGTFLAPVVTISAQMAQD